jgi:hypothetical protein
MHAGCTITCTEVITNNTSGSPVPVELKATVDFAPKDKPRGYIHWVAQPAAGQVLVAFSFL